MAHVRADVGMSTGNREATATLTELVWPAYLDGAIKDKRHLTTALGQDLAAYLNWARVEDGKRPRTLDTYERDLARGALMFAFLPRDQWAREHIRACIAAFPAGSRTRVWAAWSDFWKWQYNEDRVERNPMRGIKRPPGAKRKIIDVFTDTDKQKILLAAQDSFIPERDRLAALLFFDCGLRKNEAMNVQVGDFNQADKWVALRRTKGGDERIAYYGEDVEKALIGFLYTELPKVGRCPVPTDYVMFPHRVMGEYGAREAQVTWVDTGKPMSETAMHMWWKHRLEKAGVPHKKLHATRHTYATEMLEATGDIMAVKDSLGHASLASTEIYVHNKRERMQRGVVSLEAYREAKRV